MGRAMARALRAMARLAPPASLAPPPPRARGAAPRDGDAPSRVPPSRLPFPLAPTAPSSTAPSTPLGRLAASPPRRARYRASARLDARDGGGGDAVDKLGGGRHQLRVNEAIDARQVRLVNDGPSAPSSAPAHEVLSTIVALRRAKLAGLDLVEVNPRAVPPVCRVMNFDELRYELRQKERDARKKAVERRRHDKIKVLRLRPHISAHDLRVKAAQAARFFADGHRVTLRVEFSDADGVKPKLRPRAGAVLFEEFRAALTDATAETNEREGRDPIAFATEVEGKMIGPRHMITTFAPAREKKGKTPSAKKKKEGRRVEGAAEDRVEGASLADDRAKEEEIQTTEPSASFLDLASLESAIAAQAERTRERKARAKEAAARAEAPAEGGGGGGGDGASVEAAEAEAEAKAAVAELLALKARRAELESEPSAKDPSESESAAAAAEEEEERGEGASPRILPSSLPSRRRAASPRAARGYRSASLAAFPHLSSDRSPGGVFVSNHRLITGGRRWFSATTLADKVALAKARVAEEKERKRLAASERAAKDAARRKRREGFKKIRARGNEARGPRRDPGGDEREARRGNEEGAFRSVPKASSSSGAAAASEASASDASASDSASDASASASASDASASDSASDASASASASASPPAPASAFRMGEAFEAHVAARRVAFGHASGGHWSTSGGGGGALPPPGSTSPGSERSAAATGALALATAAAVTLGLAAAILERSDGGTTGEGEGGGAGEGEGRSGTAGGGWGASRAGDEGNRRGAGSGAASAVGKGAGAYFAGFGVASAVAVAADAWKG
jgi:translation initiation factor IF-3